MNKELLETHQNRDAIREIMNISINHPNLWETVWNETLKSLPWFKSSRNQIYAARQIIYRLAEERNPTLYDYLDDVLFDTKASIRHVQRTMYTSEQDAILTLLAIPESTQYLEMTLDELEFIYNLTGDNAALILAPAVYAINKIIQLQNE